MAITRVGSAVYTAVSAVTSRTLTIPSGIQDGDVIIVGAVKAGGTTNVTLSGITGLTLVDDNAYTGHSSSLYVKANASTSDSGATLTIATATALRASCIVVVYRGADVSGIDVTAKTQTSPSTTITAPTATSTVADVRLDLILGTGSSASIAYTTGASMTKVGEAIDASASGPAFGSLWESLTQINPATAVPADTYTASASANNTGRTILLKVKSASASVVPESQISNAGVWVPNGAASNVAALADASDATSADTPSNPTSASLIVKLGSLTSGQVSITHRSRYQTGGSGSITVKLKQGATDIASWTQALTTSYVDYVHTTTSGQTAAISDFTDLRVELLGTSA